MKTVKININDKRRIFAVQEDFNKIFPYLKIEFISPTPKRFELKDSSATIGQFRTKHNNGTLIITKGTTVANLVDDLSKNHDLSAHIFRHSGKAWLETSKTDYWTLVQQNKLGEELSKDN